jgi:hypothetical protein
VPTECPRAGTAGPATGLRPRWAQYSAREMDKSEPAYPMQDALFLQDTVCSVFGSPTAAGVAGAAAEERMAMPETTCRQSGMRD